MSNTLIGRSRELELIEADLLRVQTGARIVMLVSGEPGIGKTRLLEALAERAESHDMTVVWGRTWEVGLTPAFWPWIQLLDALAEASSHERPPLEGLPDDGARDAATRLTRFDQVASFIVKQAVQRPVVLLLEDAHAADPSSLQLFEYLARNLRKGRVLIAASTRDADGDDHARATLGRIAQVAHNIALPRLRPDDIAAIVGKRTADPMVVRIAMLSEGNPLFVHELLASSAQGTASALPAVSSVRALLRERVARLPPHTTRLLDAAALVGREFKLAIVGDMLGVAHATVSTDLEPARKVGLVIPLAPDRYRFSHALVAEALADDLAPPERAALHLSAAQSIERHEGADAAHAIAHHLLAAGHLAAEAAIHAAQRAAALAMAQLAFEDAAMLLERALAFAPPEAQALRAELWVAQAEALQHGGRYERGNAACDRAMALARTLGDAELMARVALTRGIEFTFGVTDRILVDMLSEALAALPPGDSPPRARMLARLAAAQQPAPRPDEPIALALEAIAMARRLDHRRTLVDVIDVGLAAMFEYAAPELLDELVSEHLTLVGPGDLLITLRARLRAGFVALERVDRHRFDLAVASHAELAQQVGLARHLWPTHLFRSLTALLDGRLDVIERNCAEVSAIAAELGDSQITKLLNSHMASVDFMLTRPNEAPIRQLMIDFPVGASLFRGWAALARGLPSDALDELTRLDAVAYDGRVLIMRGQLAELAGVPERAAIAYHALATYPRHAMVETMMGFAVSDIVERIRLGLASVAGMWDVVDAHGQAALAVADGFRSVVLRARVQAVWANALDQRGWPGDRARADAMWAAAHEVAERLDMTKTLAACRAARPLGEDVPAAPPREEPARRIVTITASGGLWIVRDAVTVIHVKDSRGMQMLARLVAEPGRELHALDVAGASEAADGGDAGALLDSAARDAYRARLAALREVVEDAEQRGDERRAMKAQREIEALSEELARAFGLGGRDRRAAGAAERARVNVQRRVAHALQQVASGSPELGDHLSHAIRTGTFCVYRPAR